MQQSLLEYEFFVLLNLLQLFSLGHIFPNSDDRICSSRYHILLVFRNSQCPDLVEHRIVSIKRDAQVIDSETHLFLVIIQSRNAFFILDVPNLHQPITSSTRQLHASRQEVDPENRVRVSFESLDASEIGETPKFDRSISRCRCETLINRRELDAPYSSLMTLESAEEGELSGRGSRFRTSCVVDREEFGSSILRS